MRKIFFILFIISTNAFSQQMRFFYTAPTAQMVANFGAGNIWGFERIDATGTHIPVLSGFRGVMITAANRNAFRNIAPPNLKKTYDSLTNVNSTIHRKANRIMGFSRGKVRAVEFLMIDDRTGLSNDANWFFCSSPHPTLGLIAWPCASNDSLTATNYRGHVSFGETAAASEPSFREWEATILHELSHTQMLHSSRRPDCKWGTNCVAIAYGGDDGHWFRELQADEQSPLDEGFGNFWALEHAPTLASETSEFLNNNDYRFLLGSHSFLTGIPQMWNSPNRVFATGIVPESDANGNRILNLSNGTSTYRINLVSPGISTGAGYQLREYKWLDVPGQFVFYNEIMFQAFIHLYHQNAFAVKDTSLNKIMKVAQVLSPYTDHQRHRYPALVAVRLSRLMENYANTARGQSEATSNSLVSSLFPIALYDMLSHFGQSDTDIQRNLTISMYQIDGIESITEPRAMREYMTRRAEIKRLLCPFLSNNPDCRQANAPIDMNAAMSALLTYCKDPSRILR